MAASSCADASASIYFAVSPGRRLGRHTDNAEETQFILAGEGELLLDELTRDRKQLRVARDATGNRDDGGPQRLPLAVVRRATGGGAILDGIPEIAE
mgnify:CR=1 FL=1